MDRVCRIPENLNPDMFLLYNFGNHQLSDRSLANSQLQNIFLEFTDIRKKIIEEMSTSFLCIGRNKLFWYTKQYDLIVPMM